MSRCWLEGELRAYVDRELPAAEMEAVARHLGDCEACAAVWLELKERAARVGVMLEALEHMPERRTARWGPVLVAVLAAACAVFVLWLPKRQPAAPAPKSPVAASAPAPAARQTAPLRSRLRVEPRLRAATVRERLAQPQYYVALDDEPIESGVVVRVALPDSGLLADVIYDEQGRPRAVRPLN